MTCLHFWEPEPVLTALEPLAPIPFRSRPRVHFLFPVSHLMNAFGSSGEGRDCYAGSLWPDGNDSLPNIGFFQRQNLCFWLKYFMRLICILEKNSVNIKSQGSLTLIVTLDYKTLRSFDRLIEMGSKRINLNSPCQPRNCRVSVSPHCRLVYNNLLERRGETSLLANEIRSS